MAKEAKYKNYKYGFGVAENIFFTIESRPWVWFAIVSLLYFVGLFLVRPDQWLMWIFVSPIAAWMSVALLLVIGLIEFVVWGIINVPHLIKTAFRADNKGRLYSWIASIAMVGYIVFVVVVSGNDEKETYPQDDEIADAYYDKLEALIFKISSLESRIDSLENKLQYE